MDNNQLDKIITLYDRSLHTSFKGELIFNAPMPFLPQTEALVVNPSLDRVNNSTSDQWLDGRYRGSQGVFSIINFKFLAIFCLLIAILGFISLVLPITIAESQLRITHIEKQASNLVETPQEKVQKAFYNGAEFLSAYDYVTKQAKAAELSPDDPKYKIFKVVIPKINLESNIIDNVDASNEALYSEQLKNGVAHASGSYYPGEVGPMVLFAHSTDSVAHILQYNAKFYAAKELNLGDEVDIFFHGKKYEYSMVNKKVINPQDLASIRNTDANLVLSTCYPPGTDWQRLILYAKLVKSSVI
ncbi:sortase [Candidatus Daviesbacteria bacterium]|nr:sortase [Candidatus Daviesbacteria bacterium]